MMAVQVSYPGVYIDEFAPGAPIQGVGTSTAGFIGPVATGNLREPRKVTSWDQFIATFGDQPLPGFYLWYAVRGFFENGGRICYVVRASNGEYAGGNLNNAGGAGVIRVRARQPGNPTTAIQVAVTRTHRLTTANSSVYEPTGTYTVTGTRQARLASLSQAAQFRPGDWVDLGAPDARVQVAQVNDRVLTFTDNLNSPNNRSGNIRLADLPAGSRTVRIQSTAPNLIEALVPGTVLTIAQGGTTVSGIVESTQAEMLPLTTPITTYRITFRGTTNAVLALNTAATVQSEEFTVTVTQGSSTVYPNLSIDEAHPRFFADIINGARGLIEVELIDPPPSTQVLENLPNDGVTVSLAGGANEDLNAITSQNYIAALDTLRRIDDVNFIAIPDAVRGTRNARNAIQQALISHCEQMQDRFAVLDALRPAPEQELFGAGSVEEQRGDLPSTRGYAALYYPWLRVRPIGRGAPIVVPPSGHVCGIFARSDNFRGVHKAPANEIVNGALGVQRTMSDDDQGQLNLAGINVIRVFQGSGRPVLWGARTTATDTNWQYVNIRRLFLYLEESITEGIRWAIFEPNNLQLWQKLKRTLTDFLTRVWRDGALFGATPEEAFYVRIDEVINPFSEQQLGRLHIEIGVRPSYPAEFIIVRIGIWGGGSAVSEG